MDDEKLTELVRVLEQGLIARGLSSLVDQERIMAVEGRVVDVMEGDVLREGRTRDRRIHGASRLKVGDVRVRNLDIQERLELLLDLTEAAVGGTYAIEARLREDLATSLELSSHAWDGRVVFETPPEATLGGSESVWELSTRSELASRRSAVAEVLTLLSQLRTEAGVSRGVWLATAPADAGSDAEDSHTSALGDWV
jgi:hypothetical protein